MVEVGEGGGFSWGGVEGWGEKAYNCNWITIKIKKNKIKLKKKENEKSIMFPYTNNELSER